MPAGEERRGKEGATERIGQRKRKEKRERGHGKRRERESKKHGRAGVKWTESSSTLKKALYRDNLHSLLSLLLFQSLSNGSVTNT